MFYFHCFYMGPINNNCIRDFLKLIVFVPMTKLSNSMSAICTVTAKTNKKTKLFIQLLRLCFTVIKVILYIYVNIVVISLSSVQLSSVTQSCPNLCNLMDCSIPGFPVYHTYYSLKVPYLHLLYVPNEQIIYLVNQI